MKTLLANGRVVETENQTVGWPFFSLAFRPFFWLAALFSVISIGLWTLTYTGVIEFVPYGGSYFWHTHEMLFGFSVAIIAGFLLTAVQTWTRVPSIKGRQLAVLVAIWALARVFLSVPLSIPEPVIMLVDLLFLPLAAVFLSIPVIKARMWRNLFFVPVLLIMAVLNGLMHATVQGVIDLSYLDISHMMVLMVTLVMCIMGGRVFPMFTANGTKTERVAAISSLETISIVSIVACVIAESGLLGLPVFVQAGLLIIAGVVNFIRAVRWRIWVTLKTPLLWSLHLSYWSICIGLIMLGLAKFDVLTNHSLAYHAITVGGMGGMILSMISRVSLGHTGRPIQVGKVVSVALALIVLAFVMRVLAPLVFSQYMALISVSAMLWIVAYGIFVVAYFPVLFQARVDGAAG